MRRLNMRSSSVILIDHSPANLLSLTPAISVFVPINIGRVKRQRELKPKGVTLTLTPSAK